jgi:hypothetical protein
MKTIYVVTSGDYSDYMIHAVFDNEEEAVKLADEICDSRVEKYPLNAIMDDDGRKAFDVRFKNGNTTVELCGDGETRCEIDEFTCCSYYSIDVCFSLLAKDKEHAIKIASERYAQVKAQPFLFPQWDEPCARSIHGDRPIFPYYNFITHQARAPYGYELVLDSEEE